MRYSFRTSGKTTTTNKSKHSLVFAALVLCYCAVVYSSAASLDASTSSSSSISGNGTVIAKQEDTAVNTTSTSTVSSQNVISKESSAQSVTLLTTTSSPSLVIDQQSSSQSSSSNLTSSTSDGPTVVSTTSTSTVSSSTASAATTSSTSSVSSSTTPDSVSQSTQSSTTSNLTPVSTTQAPSLSTTLSSTDLSLDSTTALSSTESSSKASSPTTSVSKNSSTSDASSVASIEAIADGYSQVDSSSTASSQDEYTQVVTNSTVASLAVSTTSSTIPESPINTSTSTTSSPVLSVDGSLAFDPSSILNFAQSLAKNTSKFTLKYLTKDENGTTASKQYGKYTFKANGDGTNFTKFVAKFLSKNVEIKKHKFTDFMSDEVRNKGGIVVHVVLLLYVCLSLGIICDLYFLTSIEYIGNSLNLPSDIAGATFMALGTSAPELFIALIGVFIAEDDIGTSTILGSAVFNLIFVPSVCGFAIYFSRMRYPKINKYSILRDAIFYMIAITTLLLALKDNEIDWIESTIMLALYSTYVFVLYLNAQLGEILDIDDVDDDNASEVSSADSEIAPLLSQQQHNLDRHHSRFSDSVGFTKSVDWKTSGRSRGSSMRVPMKRSNSIRTSSIRNGSILQLANIASTYQSLGNDVAKYSLPLLPKPPLDEEPSGMPENWAETHLLLKILMFPVVLLIKLTVPKPNRNNYYLTFIISIFWISGFTYGSVYLVTIIGYTLGLPSSVLGLTILAAGSSIPEVISSVIVVKRAGLANMALCNLFGSNIFDVLVCLGLPWLIRSCITMVSIGSTELALSVVPIQSNGLLLTTFTLLVCVVSFVLTLAYSEWKFGLSVGIMCSIIYFIAISLATTYEVLLN